MSEQNVVVDQGQQPTPTLDGVTLQTQAPQPIVQQPQVQPSQVQAQQPQQPQPSANVRTGDSVLETSINIFADSVGIDSSRFVASIQGALQYGDPELINAEVLTAGLTPDKAVQAKALATAMFQEISNQRQQVINLAHSRAGGAEQWSQAISAFNANAPEYAKAAAKSLEDSGNTAQAIEFILQQVQSYGVVNSQQGQFITPSGAQPNTTTAMSGAEFSAAFGKLQLEAGNALFNPRSPHYKTYLDLQARRDLGKRQGLA